MDGKSHFISHHLVLGNLFRTLYRKTVAVSLVVGASGVMGFLALRRLIGVNRYESELVGRYGISTQCRSRWWQLIMSVGDSAFVKEHCACVEVDGHHIRVFYAEHSLVSILPRPVPLIVFIHGLGGQINQFEPLLKYFGQVADVLALDLPGSGKSPLVDRRWHLYTTDALASVVMRVMDEKARGRKVILVGHSMGTLVAGSLAGKLGERCLGLVLLCPKAVLSDKEKKTIKVVTSLPEFVFNIFRRQDRMYDLMYGLNLIVAEESNLTV
jgi:alpha/beta hydrolase fold